MSMLHTEECSRRGRMDALASTTIASASRFGAEGLAAGVEVKGAPSVELPNSGMVWHDADSSMISAFSYDEAGGGLDVAFHRTGGYRYPYGPLHVFEGLRDAGYKGSDMLNHVIDRSPSEKRRGQPRCR